MSLNEETITRCFYVLCALAANLIGLSSTIEIGHPMFSAPVEKIPFISRKHEVKRLLNTPQLYHQCYHLSGSITTSVAWSNSTIAREEKLKSRLKSYQLRAGRGAILLLFSNQTAPPAGRLKGNKCPLKRPRSTPIDDIPGILRR